MLLPPTAGRSSTSSTGMPPNMVIPQPPHPRSRPIAGTTSVSYHAPADRTERSTKDPTPVPAHQVKFNKISNLNLYRVLEQSGAQRCPLSLPTIIFFSHNLNYTMNLFKNWKSSSLSRPRIINRPRL